MIIEIADQGCGIDEALRDRIFERGVTSSASKDHGIGRTHYKGRIIFITADNHMETISEALRLGVFDYLIKPVHYQRLQNTLERFARYWQTRPTSIEMLWKHYTSGRAESLTPGCS